METTPKWKIEESTTTAFTTSSTIPVSSLDKAGTLLQQLTVPRRPDASTEGDRMFNTVTSLPALSQNMSNELMKITDPRKRKERADHFKEVMIRIVLTFMRLVIVKCLILASSGYEMPNNYISFIFCFKIDPIFILI